MQTLAGVTGGPSTLTIDPSSDFISGDACTLTVLANKVSDQDANDPPDNMVAGFTVGFLTVDACTLSCTPIYDIQGASATAAITGTRRRPYERPVLSRLLITRTITQARYIEIALVRMGRTSVLGLGCNFPARETEPPADRYPYPVLTKG